MFYLILNIDALKGVVENAVFVIPASAIGRISLWLKGGDPVISICYGAGMPFSATLFKGRNRAIGVWHELCILI